MIGLEAVVGEGSLLLTDGGIETRIMFETGVPLLEHVLVAALVADPTGGRVLRRIYEGYVAAPSACR